MADYRLAPGVKSYAGADGDLNVVRVYWGPSWMNCGDAQAVIYHGSPQALVTLGAATTEMVMRGRRGQRRKRVDSNGDRFCVTFYTRQSADGPQDFCRLVRHAPRERLLLLPGAEAARAINEGSRVRMDAAGDAIAAYRMLEDDRAEFPETVQHEVDELLRRFLREVRP